MVASAADASALDAIDTRWREALAQARSRFASRVRGAGAVLDPDSALARPEPAPGPYRCRVFRLGSPAPRAPAFSVSREGFCFVGVGEEDRLTLTTEPAAKRVGGYLWETRQPRRLVFLGGGIARARGTAAPYRAGGSDAAGVFERYDEFRYRLILPDGSSGLSIIELVAAPRL